MEVNQKGFSVFEGLIVIVVIGLVGVVGWLVYDRQNNKTENESTTTSSQIPETTANNSKASSKTSNVQTVDGIKYSVPEAWKSAKGPFKDPEVAGSGQYLLSPDYQEAGDGQLSILAGAAINIKKLNWNDINASTTPEQAVAIVRNGEGGYLDPRSVKLASVNNKSVVMFNDGHTTDGVTVFYKTASGTWLDASFFTKTGGDGTYNAQDSPLYETFQSWLEELVRLNP